MGRKGRPAGIKSIDINEGNPAEIGRAGGGRDARNPRLSAFGHPMLTAFYQKPGSVQTTFI
jgi:hypothetical protein